MRVNNFVDMRFVFVFAGQVLRSFDIEADIEDGIEAVFGVVVLFEVCFVCFLWKLGSSLDQGVFLQILNSNLPPCHQPFPPPVVVFAGPYVLRQK